MTQFKAGNGKETWLVHRKLVIYETINIKLNSYIIPKPAFAMFHDFLLLIKTCFAKLNLHKHRKYAF